VGHSADGIIGGDIGRGLAVQRLLVCGGGVLPGGGQVQSAPGTVVWAGMTVAVVRAVLPGGRRLRAAASMMSPRMTSRYAPEIYGVGLQLITTARMMSTV
jgi:hypothetical protein